MKCTDVLLDEFVITDRAAWYGDDADTAARLDYLSVIAYSSTEAIRPQWSFLQIVFAEFIKFSQS